MNDNKLLIDRLSQLINDVSREKKNQREIDAELNSIYQATEFDYVQEKLSSALVWSSIYFSPRRWKKWGDISVVKSFLISDIHKAEMGLHSLIRS